MTARVMDNSRLSLPGFLKRGGNFLTYNNFYIAFRGIATRLSALLSGLLVSVAAFAGSPLSTVESESMDVVVVSSDSLSGAERHDTTSFAVYYRVAKSRIDRGYRGNAASLDAAAAGLREVVHSRDLRIHKVVIIGAASPEGPKSLNMRLARDRAESVKTFLKGIEPRLTDEDFVIVSRGEDWEGATRIAESFDTIAGNNAVSSIFKGDKDSEAKKSMMKMLDGGKAWHEMITSYYPALRRSDIHVLYGTVRPIQSVTCSPVLLEVPYSENLAPRTLFPQSVNEYLGSKYYSFALKSNLLYDAVTALNFAAEFPVGKRFSVQYEHIFPWWTAGPNGNKYSMQVLSVGGEARWWFSKRERKENVEIPEIAVRRDLLLGHYLGLYADAGKFDVQAGRKFGCYQTYFKSAGLSYGYSLPVGKRVNFEFSLSVGYALIDYQHYIPSDDWSVLLRDNDKAGTKHYFGPTKATVSLVVPIVFKCGGRSR